MAPVKVIVQGISIISDDAGKESESGSNENKVKLEELFAIHGPLKCVYLWPDEASYAVSAPYKRRRLGRGEKALDPFAHILFKNASDAATACQAAANHEIKFNNSILTLTAVPDSLVPIENLDNNCLIKIFSFLDIEKRLEIEEVCKRWKEVSQDSWSDVKKICLTSLDDADENIEKYLTRCGKYLQKMVCAVDSSVVPNLILKHCEQVEALELHMYLDDPEEDVLSEMFMGLKNLKRLKLDHHDIGFEFPFLQYLPESMEKISFFCGAASRMAPYDFDLSRFRNLRKLALKAYLLHGAGHVVGIDGMENLSHVDFEMSETYRSLTRQFQQLTKLRKLIIPKSGITDDILIQILTNNPGLECLDISEAVALTDRSMQLVSTLENLEDLDISLLSVTLEFMDRMPSLRTLECRKCNNLTNEAMGRLIQLAPNLRILRLAGSSVTPNLFAIANAAVSKRTNDVRLSIGTSYSRNVVRNIENFSPLLTIEFDQKPDDFFWEAENDYPPDPLNDEPSDDDDDDHDDHYYNDDDNDDDRATTDEDSEEVEDEEDENNLF